MPSPAGPAAGAATDRPAWPALPYAEWRDTYETLHRWLQIVGKTRLALAPMVNHWWQATYYVTARGLSTGVMPCRERAFEAEFDFIDHALVLRASDGATRSIRLAPRSVADFYREYRATLDGLRLPVRIFPRPSELPDAIPFAEDRAHAAYDAAAARRCWQILVESDRVLRAFRGRFIGKASPVHLFWGAFDLACTRFSGRRAPPHPGGVPNLPDRVTREAYSHECISAGWWPGGGPLEEAAYYAYAYPEPDGCSAARVRPDAAYYHRELREFILPYEAVRTASDPDATLLEFLQSTYEAAAKLGGWDRTALEVAPPA